MNRRNFLRNILVAGASFTILPSTGRIWRARYSINPAWVTAPYEIAYLRPSVFPSGMGETIRGISGHNIATPAQILYPVQILH